MSVLDGGVERNGVSKEKERWGCAICNAVCSMQALLRAGVLAMAVFRVVSRLKGTASEAEREGAIVTKRGRCVKRTVLIFEEGATLQRSENRQRMMDFE